MIDKKQILSLAELAKLEFTQAEIEKLEDELNHRLQNITNPKILQVAWEMSALSRIDGVRYSPSYPHATSYEELYIKTRTNHFDFNTKATILLGCYVALEENYEKYFGKAFAEHKLTEVSLSSLRQDEVKPSLDRSEIMKKAPQTNGEYFVVPQVVEE